MIQLPDHIYEALEHNAALAISISGGKDSQAMLIALMKVVREYGYEKQTFAIHADLGRAEWSTTPAHVEKICQEQEVELVVVRRQQGDLLAHMQQRMEQLRGQNKPHFPSSAARYCTSDHKRAPIDKYLRQFDLVISAEGIRAREGAARAKKPDFERREQICTLNRLAYTWRPILDWTEEQVWQEIGITQRELDRRRLQYAAGYPGIAMKDWPAHPAYVLGNDRVSCSICILASKQDIQNGVRHHPEYHAALVAMEKESGFSFRQNLSLKEIKP